MCSACALSTLLWVQPCVSGAPQPLVLHSGSSCTHPFSYYTMHSSVVYPYWSACPPDRRLCSKPYKPIDHPTNFVPERSMLFRVGCCSQQRMVCCASLSFFLQRMVHGWQSLRECDSRFLRSRWQHWAPGNIQEVHGKLDCVLHPSYCTAAYCGSLILLAAAGAGRWQSVRKRAAAVAGQAMTLKHNVRIWLAAAGLQVAGRRKTAGLVRASWRVWKLYNTSTMDFHLFYCSRNLVELQVGPAWDLHVIYLDSLGCSPLCVARDYSQQDQH